MSQTPQIFAESSRPISLTRTRAQTIRFHLLSVKGKAAFVALFVVVAVVVASVLWTRISEALSGATHSVAEGRVGSPTPQPTVDVRPLLTAQHRLDTAITDATNAVAAARPYADLADARAKVNAALTRAKKPLNTDMTVTALNAARTRLDAAVGDLPSKTAAAKAAADKAAADKAAAAAQSAQASQAARAAQAAAAAAAAEAAKQRQSGSSGSTGGSSGTRQAPAPAPAPATVSASTGVTAYCSTAASITFTATGSGTVTLSAGGRSASGGGSASLTVSGGPGSYSASATASSSVSIRFSSTGACS